MSKVEDSNGLVEGHEAHVSLYKNKEIPWDSLNTIRKIGETMLGEMSMIIKKLVTAFKYKRELSFPRLGGRMDEMAEGGTSNLLEQYTEIGFPITFFKSAISLCEKFAT